MITSVRRPCITPLRRLFSTCNYQCKTHRMLTVNPRFCIFQEAFRACPKPENFTRLLSDSVPSSPSHLPSLSRGSDPGSCGFPWSYALPCASVLCALEPGPLTMAGWCALLAGFWLASGLSSKRPPLRSDSCILAFAPRVFTGRVCTPSPNDPDLHNVWQAHAASSL